MQTSISYADFSLVKRLYCLGAIHGDALYNYSLVNNRLAEVIKFPELIRITTEHPYKACKHCYTFHYRNYNHKIDKSHRILTLSYGLIKHHTLLTVWFCGKSHNSEINSKTRKENRRDLIELLKYVFIMDVRTVDINQFITNRVIYNLDLNIAPLVFGDQFIRIPILGMQGINKWLVTKSVYEMVTSSLEELKSEKARARAVKRSRTRRYSQIASD